MTEGENGKIEYCGLCDDDDVASKVKAKELREKKLHDKHFHSIKRNNESCCEVVGLLASTTYCILTLQQSSIFKGMKLNCSCE